MAARRAVARSPLLPLAYRYWRLRSDSSAVSMKRTMC